MLRGKDESHHIVEQEGGEGGLHWLDVVLICAYFILVISIGLYDSVLKPFLFRFLLPKLFPGRKLNHSSLQEQQTAMTSSHAYLEDGKQVKATNDAESFFLASKNVSFFAIGCSLFASNIGSEHFIGLASSGAIDGLCVGWGEWLSPIAILFLAWLFVPFYIKTKVYTIPQFIEYRYNRACRMYLTSLSLLLYILTKISVTLYAGNIVVRSLLGIQSDYLSFFLLIATTSIYTIIGGLRAVIYTEVIQSIILVIGSILVFTFGMIFVGGWNGLFEKLAIEQGRPDLFHLFQPITHEHFPWTGVTFGMLLGPSLWYWCTDQVIVQRALSAKNLNHAQGGCLLAGFMKILPVFVMVVPGMMARALFPDEVKQNPNKAYIILVNRILPLGCRGIMIAAMLAALMSSLASVFHSSSTLFTMDIYRTIRPSILQCMKSCGLTSSATQSSSSSPPSDGTVVRNQYDLTSEDVSQMNTEGLVEEQQGIDHQGDSPDTNDRLISQHDTGSSQISQNREFAIVGRIAGVVVTILGMAWIPVVPLLSQELYIYTHKIMSYYAPSIAMTFLVGVLIPRVNGIAAFITLITGLIIGSTRLILEVIYANTHEQDLNIVLGLFVKMNFLHFSALFLLFSFVILIVISLLTRRPSIEVQRNYTILSFFNRKECKTNDNGNDENQSEVINGTKVDEALDVIESEKRKRINWRMFLNFGATFFLATSLISLYIIFR